MQSVREDFRCKVLAVVMSVVLAFGLIPTIAFATDDDEDGVEVDGISYALYDVDFEGTGDYSGSTWDVLGTMVYKYFGYDVYVSEALDDGSYNLVVYFGGSDGYSDAIEDFTIYSDSSNSTEAGTVSQSTMSGLSDDPVYVFNVDDPSETIYCGLYVGGAMDMSVTFSITADWTEPEAEEEDAAEEEAESSSGDESEQAESDDAASDDADASEGESSDADDEASGEDAGDGESSEDGAEADSEEGSDAADDDEAADSEDAEGIEVDGVSYALYDVDFEGTGDYAGTTWDVLGTMVYKYFGYDVYVSEQLDDGTYNLVVYFGGESGYSEAIGDFTLYSDSSNEIEAGTVGQSDMDGLSDDPVYVFNVEDPGETIYCYLYIGGSMGMGVTFSITADWSDDGAAEDDADSDATEDDEDATEEEAEEDADDSSDSSSSSSGSTSGSSSSSSSSSSGSSSSSSKKSSSSSSTDSNGLEIGATYSMDVSYEGTGAYSSGTLNTTLQNMVSQYFGYSVYVTPLEDGTYDVVVYFGGSDGYSTAVGDLTYEGRTISQASDTTYTINVDSIDEPIALSLYVGGAMDLTVTYEMTIDVDSATMVASGSGSSTSIPVDKSSLKSALKTAKALSQGSKTDSAWEALQDAIAEAQAVYDDDDATQAEVSKAVAALTSAIDTFNNSSSASSSSSGGSVEETGWQVGHTYEVPMTFLKHNDTETSMAADYFGDTALVYVLSSSELEVTWAATSEGLEEIDGVYYENSQITPDGDQFSITIPASYEDTAIPLDMDIHSMSLLGVGVQTCDLYLYLTQAVDLGSGLEGMEASSSNSTSLSDTGDDLPARTSAVAAVALASGALAGVAFAASRRSRREDPSAREA